MLIQQRVLTLNRWREHAILYPMILRRIVLYLLLLGLVGCQPVVPVTIQPGSDGLHLDRNPIRRVDFTFTGDLLFETALYTDATNYDFGPYFEGIKPYLVGDFVVGNQEVTIGGAELGISGRQFIFNAPKEVAFELAKAGFNVLTLSNNHVYDKGFPGVVNTLKYVRDAGMLPIGLYETPEEAQTMTILEKNGLRIAVLTYTYSINRKPPPELQFITNVFLTPKRVFDQEREARLRADIRRAKTLSDAVIVSIHWGNEFTYTLNTAQRRAAAVMNEEGVDVVIGNHPHTPQTAQVLTSSTGYRTVVFYSLGNLVSAETDDPRAGDVFDIMYQTGILVQLTLIKNTHTNTITTDHIRIIPVVNHFDRGRINFRLIPLAEYTEELALQHAQHETIPLFTKAFIDSQMELLYGDFLKSLKP